MLEHLPEDSKFKEAAERGGRWPDWKKMLAECANTAYHSLAWYLAVHSTDDVDLRFDPEPFLFIDPVDAEKRREKEQAAAVEAAKTEPELVDAGWM